LLKREAELKAREDRSKADLVEISENEKRLKEMEERMKEKRAKIKERETQLLTIMTTKAQ